MNRSFLALLSLVTTACVTATRPDDPPPDDTGLADAAPPPPPPQIDAAPWATCGNSIIEPGETCDPPSSCPTACDDTDPCSTDALTGVAATCTARCAAAAIEACGPIDGCCPHGCGLATDSECPDAVLAPDYVTDYWLVDLGQAPGVPPLYGGLTVSIDDPDVLLIGGHANTGAGMVYSIGVTRNGFGHITGFVGTATPALVADYNDGGVLYGPGDVLFLARWPVNGLGQRLPGSAITDKIIDLAGFGVASSGPGGLVFVPPDLPGAGLLKIAAWPGGQWYSAELAADATGTYDIDDLKYVTTIVGGPEGIAFVPPGSPVFPAHSILVSEFSAGVVSTYEVTDDGDPIVATRADFVLGLSGAEGAAIDPGTGDYLFSTFGGGDHVIVVRGFAPIVP